MLSSAAKPLLHSAFTSSKKPFTSLLDLAGSCFTGPFRFYKDVFTWAVNIMYSFDKLKELKQKRKLPACFLFSFHSNRMLSSIFMYDCKISPHLPNFTNIALLTVFKNGSFKDSVDILPPPRATKAELLELRDPHETVTPPRCSARSHLTGTLKFSPGLLRRRRCCQDGLTDPCAPAHIHVPKGGK